MTNKTRMVILLKDGEEIRGVIEWYDKHALKVHRADAPNILLLKDNIKYMYKENEDKGLDED
jgi:small nuclear ribonucleoprotein (snRNP)-like protein